MLTSLFHFFSSYTPISLPSNSSAAFLAQDKIYQNKLLQLIHAFPRAEPSLIHFLSHKIPPSTCLFLGNSLPIREWDLAASWQHKISDVYASRGLNGIDGQLSTFFGLASPARENWGIVGDLTALHDLSGGWILAQLKDHLIRLVIINNQGGKIFRRMLPLQEIENSHNYSFKPLADLWELAYEKWATIPDSISNTPHQLIELCPDNDASMEFSKELDLLHNC